MAPISADENRHLDAMIQAAQANAPAVARTVEYFGEDSPKVVANAGLGIPFSSASVSTQQSLDEMQAYHDLVIDHAGSVWMDNTTVFTGVTLLSEAGRQAMTPLTIWDLATLIRAIVGYEHIHHHQHPLIVDHVINERLEADVLRPIPLPEPVGAMPSAGKWQGPQRFLWELKEQAVSWLRRLEEADGQGTLEGRELLRVRDAWRRALGRQDIEASDLTDWKDLEQRWMSPTARLLREIADVTSAGENRVDEGPSEALRMISAARGAPDRVTRPWLADTNLRAYINQTVADFFELPYLCGAARVPFRKHLFDRAVAIQQRLTALDVIDDRYGQLATGVELRLPVFLARVLQDADDFDDVWEAVAVIREKAEPYRDARIKLDRALARQDKKEVAKVNQALSKSREGVVSTLGGATAGGALAAVEQCASGDPTLLSSGISGLVAATQRLLSSSLCNRIAWRMRRPYLLWMNNVIDEAQCLTEAWPELERVWQIPEKEKARFTAGFEDMAELQRL